MSYKIKYLKLQHGGEYSVTKIHNGLLYGKITILDGGTILRTFMQECSIEDIPSYEYIYTNHMQNIITEEMLDNKVSTLEGYKSNEEIEIVFIDNTFTRIKRGHKNNGIFFKGDKILKFSDGDRLKTFLDKVPTEILDLYPKKYFMTRSFIFMEKFDHDLTDYFFTYLPLELIKTKFDNNQFLIELWNSNIKNIITWSKPSPITLSSDQLILLMPFIHSLIDVYRNYAYKFWFDVLRYLKTMRKYDYKNLDLKWDNLAVDKDSNLRFIDEESGLKKNFPDSVIEIGKYMNQFMKATIFDNVNLESSPIFSGYKLKQYKTGDLVNLIPKSLVGLENFKIIKINNPHSLMNTPIKHIQWQSYQGGRVIFTIFLDRDIIEIEHKTPRSLGLKRGSTNRDHDLTIINPMIQGILKSSEITEYGSTRNELKLTEWKHAFGEDEQDILWIDEPKPYGNTTICKIEENIATMINGGKFELPELTNGGYHIDLEWPSNDLKFE